MRYRPPLHPVPSDEERAVAMLTWPRASPAESVIKPFKFGQIALYNSSVILTHHSNSTDPYQLVERQQSDWLKKQDTVHWTSVTRGEL
ncbi:unnamed protein product [Nezara viridula]|uniref:Uncharacterized protein n=1 Tax=Nezara viridula TaxID=85310 RepID=A0A9P0HNY0_NEZVI|nr:unnamed protein product [Nezara viridula]